MDVRSCGMQGPPAERQPLRLRMTLIDKGQRLATIGVKTECARCTCVFAPLSKAQLKLPVQHTGSYAWLRKTRRAAGALRARPKKSRAFPLTMTYMDDLHGSRLFVHVNLG